MFETPGMECISKSGSNFLLRLLVKFGVVFLVKWNLSASAFSSQKNLCISMLMKLTRHVFFFFFQVGMELHISKVHSDDFGNYKCIAKNPRGQTDGDITLTGTNNNYENHLGAFNILRVKF